MIITKRSSSLLSSLLIIVFIFFDCIMCLASSNRFTVMSIDSLNNGIFMLVSPYIIKTEIELLKQTKNYKLNDTDNS